MLHSYRILAVSLFLILLFPACTSRPESPQQLSLNGLLIVEEYPLKSLECQTDPESRCFQPVSGTFEEITSKRQEEREKLTDPMPWLRSDTVEANLDGKPLIASLIFPSGGDRTDIAVQVVHGDEIIYTRSLGTPSPLNPLQGLWVVDGHWYLEVAEYIPGSKYPYARGLIIRDGELLNERLGYQEAFAFSLLRGKPFFFLADRKIDAYLDGETIRLGYEEVAHYGCCSAARLNPIKAENMISFFARRDSKWFYVEAGIYE